MAVPIGSSLTNNRKTNELFRRNLPAAAGIPLSERLSKLPISPAMPTTPITSPVQPVAAPPQPVTAPLPTAPQAIQSIQPKALDGRLTALPIKGPVGSLPQFANIKQKILADLPAHMFIEGVNNIIAGKNSSNEYANNFVRRLSAQGKTPEQIRQAFINEQSTSQDPLVIL